MKPSTSALSRVCVLLFPVFISHTLYGQADTTVYHFKNQADTNNFSNIKEYGQRIRAIKKIASIPNTIKEEKEDDFIEARFKRNGKLNLLFAENVKVSTFQFGFQQLEGKQTHIFDANVNFTFLALPKLYGFGLLINPRFNMRMFLKQESAPIRTPSNLIGGTLYKHINRSFNETYRFASFSFYHHSNGQDSGSYNPDGSLDLKTGNFAVNSYSIDFMIGQIKNGQWILKRKHNLNYYGKVGYQIDDIINSADYDVHPITKHKALKDEYGIHRINLELSVTLRINKRLAADQAVTQDNELTEEVKADTTISRRRKLRIKYNHEDSPYQYWRLVFESSAILTNPGRLNAEIKLYYKIPYSPNFLVTVQGGWLGQDNYNIYFQQQTWYIRFGVAAMFFAGPGAKDIKADERYKAYLEQ